VIAGRDAALRPVQAVGWGRMRNVVYDVAASIDGFIAGEDGDVSGFQMEGDHLTDYQQRLKGYDTVLMGRATYEWGYQYGLAPGALAYPHMRHYVFSKTLRFDDSPVVVIDHDEVSVVRRLKEEGGSDIYLCGGGTFAGFLLDHGLVDQLVIKQNPRLLGHGVRLFGASTRSVVTELVDARIYDSGVLLLRYDLRYRS
jgi:dihydrofolate reductase